MLISTKGRYALRVMIDLAENYNGNYIALKEIASRQEISEKYLETVISILVKAKFVEGLRGKGGGYRLTRSPSDYTAGSVLRITEESLSPVACLSCKPNNCSRALQCRTLPMWQKLDEIINKFFDDYTIASLAENADLANNYII